MSKLKQEWQKSPFAVDRIKPVGLAVVHSMGERIKLDAGPVVNAYEFLISKQLAAHSLLKPDGTHIRMADTRMQVSHAKGYNQISFGLEFLVPGDHNYQTFLEAIADTGNPPFTDAQYEAGGIWLAIMCKEHGLNWTDVKGHSTIDPSRKKDPGAAFDWAKLKQHFDAEFSG